MAFDGLFLHLLKNELKDLLIGARVEKLHLPTKNELVLSLKNRGGAYRLLLSASGSAPRICTTEQAPENPMNPPMLCMLFRKQLLSAVLTDLRQVSTDRILFLDFDATNTLGDRVKRTIVIEIMAQHSNIILLDENEVVIDSIKRVDLLKSSVRQILPGIQYRLPPQQDKPSLLDTSSDEIIERLSAKPQLSVASALLSCVLGFSPLIAREIAYRANLSDSLVADLNEKNREDLSLELDKLRSTILKREVFPNSFYQSDGKPLDFSFMPILQYGSAVEVKVYDSLSSVPDKFYFERERRARAKAKAEDLFRLLSSSIERTTKKINSQKAELLAAADRETKRIFAELINANLYRLEKGAVFYDLENYYDDNRIIRIPAQPQLSPSQNSQRYYKEYRKAQTAEKILTEQIAKGEQELEYLLSVYDLLGRCDSEKEFAAIRDELALSGFIKKHAAARQKKPTALPPLEYTSPDGFKVLVGRNNIQNDRLTFKTAAKNDIWLHTQKIHGSHTVLVTEGREPTVEAMEFAAGLAAYHSSARESRLVPVDYTQIKNLKKPNGAAPGFVIYHIYKTIIIDPLMP